jgi:hypothetical protein
MSSSDNVVNRELRVIEEGKKAAAQERGGAAVGFGSGEIAEKGRPDRPMWYDLV